MSDIDKTGCISHRANSHFFVMHEDFLDVAKVSEHQYKLAAFWRVLETKTNERKIYNDGLIEDCKKKGLPEPETTLWIEISYNEFARRTLGVYKASSFQIAAAESERLGFSKSRVQHRLVNPLDPQSAKIEYKEYLFLVEEMQTAINSGVLPTPIENNSPLLKAYNERKGKKNKPTPVDFNTPPIEINTPPIVFNTTPPVEINTPPIEINKLNNITNIDTKDNKDNNISNVESASADIDATHNPPSPPSKKRGGRKRSEENNTSNETAQPTLIEMPAAPPTIPAEDAKWCAETLVQIVEAKRNKRFEEITRTVKGKVYKTQRQRQLEAADVIIKAKFTREQFEQGYDHRLDDWWIQERGDLTVVDMINNTTKGTMRLIEELEKIASQAKRMQNRPTSQGQTIKHGQRPEDYENSEVSRNNTSHLEQVLAKHKAMLATQGKGA